MSPTVQTARQCPIAYEADKNSESTRLARGADLAPRRVTGYFPCAMSRLHSPCLAGAAALAFLSWPAHAQDHPCDVFKDGVGYASAKQIVAVKGRVGID